MNAIAGYSSVQGRMPNAQEIAQRKAEMFSKADTSQDGTIDSTEFATMMSSMPQMPKTETSPKSMSLEDIFSSIDTDADGALTQEEMEANAQKMQEQMRSRMPAMGMNGSQPPPRGEGQEEQSSTNTIETLIQILEKYKEGLSLSSGSSAYSSSLESLLGNLTA